MLETVDLDAGATQVPEPLLEPLFVNDRCKVMGDLASILLDRHLRRLSRMRNPVELNLARMLGQMQRDSGYLDLGFARMSDYVTERLGIGTRRMQVLIQMQRRLAELPVMAAAFETGEISQSQVRLLLRVATPGNETSWVERASRLSVRRLEREVRAARAAGASDGSPAPSAGSPGTLAGSPASPGEEIPTDGEEESGRMVSFPTPGDVRSRWDWAVEVCRRTSGASEPVWRAAEYIAADYLAGVPDLTEVMEEVGDGATAGIDEPIPGPVGEPEPHGCQEQDDQGIELFEEVLKYLEKEPVHSEWPTAAEDLEVSLPAELKFDPTDTPRRLDARLRRLIHLRQSLAWQQGRLLSTFSSVGLHRYLGFHSLGRYCRERLGIGLRKARQLIALDRRLLELPDLAAEYRKGAISWVRATAVASVARESSEREWIRIAGAVTVRRLREEVARAARRRRWGRPLGLDESGQVRLRTPGEPRPDGVQTCAPPEREASSPMTRIRFWAPDEVARLWHHAIDVCRIVEGRPLEEWECVDRMVESFRRTYEVRGDAAWQRRYRVFERDGWRCRAPGCTSRRNLQAHHVTFRSLGGGDEDDNLVSLCATHHHQGIHEGRLRCQRLPDRLLAWELGTAPDGTAVERYVEDVFWRAARGAGDDALESGARIPQ